MKLSKDAVSKKELLKGIEEKKFDVKFPETAVLLKVAIGHVTRENNIPADNVMIDSEKLKQLLDEAIIELQTGNYKPVLSVLQISDLRMIRKNPQQVVEAALPEIMEFYSIAC